MQSTRAGAGFGLGLALVVVLANVAKYPAFAFGPRYAAVTGCSLLEGYRRQGAWALWLYAVATVGTMFTVQAAVTFMTAGLLVAVFHLSVSPVVVSALLIAACAALLAIGHYRWLDRIMKVVVAALTLLTLAATALILPRVPWSTIGLFPHGLSGNVAAIGFVAALVGWMPSAIDVAVWHSLWSLARARDTDHRPSVADAMFDFNVGYVGTAILAVCFVLLGAGVLHGSGRELPASAGAFAVGVIDMYAAALGEWSRPFFGITALMVMLSTTLTVVDGFPRALSTLVARFRSPEAPHSDVEIEHRRMYWSAVILLGIGSVGILVGIRTRLLLLVDVATVLSFLTAPALAVLNHRAMAASGRPPSRSMMLFSLVSIAALGIFAIYYLYLRIFSS